jgi:hypothetical protein
VARGVLRLAIATMRKMRAGQKVDSLGAIKILARTLQQAQETGSNIRPTPGRRGADGPDRREVQMIGFWARF